MREIGLDDGRIDRDGGTSPVRERLDDATAAITLTAAPL
jgi:hypothetical protein